MYHDTNVAAWMIAGGNRHDDPAEGRARSHRRALKASRPASASLREWLGAALTARRSATIGTTLAAAGTGTTQLDAACCAA